MVYVNADLTSVIASLEALDMSNIVDSIVASIQDNQGRERRGAGTW